MARGSGKALSRGEVLALKATQQLNTARHWAVGQMVRGLFGTLRRLPADRALDFADRAARRVGPLSARHKVAVENLRLAYPDKTEAEIESIAVEMWGQMARLGAEYVFLDELFDFDPARSGHGRIEVQGEEIFQRIAAEKKPHIIFTGHLGNFEMLPVAAAAFGLKVTALFRAPNNPYVANYVSSTRSGTMGDLLASRAGAAFALSRIMDDGGNIGLLVDQRFHGGSSGTFFGRSCQTNPLLAKLARHHECDVYPARCIRLPGNRYRLEIEEKLDLPLAPDGRVDLDATAQLLNETVERWIRDHPSQWMWFHKRWGMSSRRKRWRAAPRQS